MHIVSTGSKLTVAWGPHPVVCCPRHQQVIAGKDKGTVAEIEKVLPTRGMVVVKGVNVKVCVFV